MSAVEPQDRWTLINGLRLHYVEWGKPDLPTIVALHGFLGHARVWDSFSQAMESCFRVLALDQRGHGDSQWATDGYGTPNSVQDLAEFIRALGLEQPVVMGHSMGGLNAIVYASSHPAAVGKLIIVDIGPEFSPRAAERAQRNPNPDPGAFDTEEEVVAFLRRQASYPSDTVLRNSAHHSLRRREDGKLIWKWDPALTQQRRGGAGDMWAMVRQITCPTLMVRGAESFILDHDVAVRTVEAMPQAQLAEIPRAEHNVAEDNPEDFTRAVAAFLGVGTPAA